MVPANHYIYKTNKHHCFKDLWSKNSLNFPKQSKHMTIVRNILVSEINQTKNCGANLSLYLPEQIKQRSVVPTCLCIYQNKSNKDLWCQPVFVSTRTNQTKICGANLSLYLPEQIKQRSLVPTCLCIYQNKSNKSSIEKSGITKTLCVSRNKLNREHCFRDLCSQQIFFYLQSEK